MATRGKRGATRTTLTRAVLPTNESASLWNYTIAPGWTKEEVEVLRLALIKFGVGNWTQIAESGCLPGKTIAQLNNQTQRMLGQQSTAEFAGLHIDVTLIGEKNSTRQGADVKRKSGVIVNTGDKLKSEEIRRRIEENRLLYEVSKQEWEKTVLPEPKIQLQTLALLEEKRTELRQLRLQLRDVQTKIALRTTVAASQHFNENSPLKKAKIEN